MLAIDEEENEQEDGSDEESSVSEKDDDEPDQSDGAWEQQLGGDDDYTTWHDDNGAEPQNNLPLDNQHWLGGDGAATWFTLTLHAVFVKFLCLFGASLNMLSSTCLSTKVQTCRARLQGIGTLRREQCRFRPGLGNPTAGGHVLNLMSCSNDCVATAS